VDCEAIREPFPFKNIDHDQALLTEKQTLSFGRQSVILGVDDDRFCMVSHPRARNLVSCIRHRRTRNIPTPRQKCGSDDLSDCPRPSRGRTYPPLVLNLNMLTDLTRKMAINDSVSGIPNPYGPSPSPKVFYPPGGTPGFSCVAGGRAHINIDSQSG